MSKKRITDFTLEQIEFIIFQLLSGVEETQIAKQLSVPVSTIRDIMESEKFNELWNDILQTIRSRIEDKIDKALDIAINKMIELMNSTDEKIALEASKSMLKLRFGNFEGNKSAIVINPQITKGNQPVDVLPTNKNIVELVKEYRRMKKLPIIEKNE